MTAIPLVSMILWGFCALIAYLFISGFIWGAGYFPTSTSDMKNIAKLADMKEGSVVYDLGSGFGKIVAYLAQNLGAKCVGVEIDPFKCWWSRMIIRQKGLSERVRIVRSNLFDVDVSEADVVYIFLSDATKIMKHLKPKLLREMRPGSKVISFHHKFEDWRPETNLGDLRVYVVPAIRLPEEV